MTLKENSDDRSTKGIHKDSLRRRRVGVKARTVLTAAVVFALAMGALERGGWWWVWLGVTLWGLLLRYRFPLIRSMRRSVTHRYFRHIRRGDRKNRRAQRRLARQQRRAMKRHQ